jgi:hypothetical protein
MSYIGTSPVGGLINSQYFSGDGSTLTFNLTYSYTNEAALLVFITGVKQKSDSYSVIGGQLIFSAAPPAGTQNIEVIYLSGSVLTALATVANTNITGNIISSQITSVANTQITGNIISSQISANLTLYGNTTISGNLVSSTGAQLSLPNTTSTLGFINIPPVGQKSAAYTLTTLDVGKYVEQANANGTITVPNTTFSSGDVVSVFNNTNTTLTITCSAVTAWAAGNNTSKTSVNVSTRGVASVLFISSNVCVITGTLAS